MAGNTKSEKQILQSTAIRVTGSAVQIIIDEQFSGSAFTYGQLQEEIMRYETRGEFTSGSETGRVVIPTDSFMGFFSGAADFYNAVPDGVDAFHWTSFSGSFNGTMNTYWPYVGQAYPSIHFGDSNSPKGLSGSIKCFGTIQPSASIP